VWRFHVVEPPLLSGEDRVVRLQRHLLTASATDADQHLSIGSSIAPAHRCVNRPSESEVGRAECPAGQRDVVDDNRVVAMATGSETVRLPVMFSEMSRKLHFATLLRFTKAPEESRTTRTAVSAPGGFNCRGRRHPSRRKGLTV